MKNKKVLWISLSIFLALCLVTGAVFVTILIKNGQQNNPQNFEQRSVTVNYKDIIYIPEYFEENDDFSNAKLYAPERQPLSLNDGYLFIDTMGVYELELYGSKILYSFQVTDTSGPVVSLNEQSAEVFLGDTVTIRPSFLDNTDGKITLKEASYTITKRGNLIEVSNDQFVAEELGQYVLEFDLTDSSGNRAESIVINCVMPKRIMKPVDSEITLTDDLFRGLIDETKQYTFDSEITRVTENGSSAVEGITFTLDKKSIYKIYQVAACGEEVIELNYIYYTDKFLIYDFDDQDLSMISITTGDALSAHMYPLQVSDDNAAIQIKSSPTNGSITIYVSGLEPNTTYEMISYKITVTDAPGAIADSPIFASYNDKDFKKTSTIVFDVNEPMTVLYSDITTDEAGRAALYNYICTEGDIEFIVDDLVVRKSIDPVQLDKGVFIDFSGNARMVEKEHKDAYSTLYLDVTGGWSTISVFATKDAGLAPNAKYTVKLDVKCDGEFPSFFEDHKDPETGKSVNDFVLGAPGGAISFTVITDENGEFTKIWDNSIYLQTETGLSYVEFTSIEIEQFIDTVEVAKDVYLTFEGGAQVKKKPNANNENYDNMYLAVTRGSWSTLKLSAGAKAGLAPNAMYTVKFDVKCDGEFPSFFDAHEDPETGESVNDFVLGAPGGAISFTVITDENGEFTKIWDNSIYLQTETGLSYVEFTSIEMEQFIDTVEVAKNVYLTFEGGAQVKKKPNANNENYDNMYLAVTRGSWSTLKLSAGAEAGLAPNAKYTVKLDVKCDGEFPSFFDAHEDPETGKSVNDFVLGAPGGTISFNVTTDENGEFTKIWDNSIYLQTETGLSYVEFTGITVDEVVSIYSEGITIVPYETEGQADFTVTEKKADGKTYVSISEIATHGYANLKLSANADAGLKANTYYNVILDVACNGESSTPVYFDDTATNGTPKFIIWGGGGQIKFNVQTDANGEFIVDWTKVYLNPVGLTYVDFTGITVTEAASVYPAGVTIVPYETEGQADFTVTEKNADGKTYVSISEIALHGYANLKLSASADAGLKANTYYNVVLDVACNGESSAPVYFDDTATNGTPRFIIWGGGGQIKFNVQTDANGEFVVDWTKVYLNPVGLTYVDFTGITVAEAASVYPAGVTIVPYETEGQADFTVTEKNADGKTYVSISEIALHGYANLKLSATQEAGLKANTYYYVVVDVACDGNSSDPAYFDTTTNGTPEFIIWGGGGQIKFNVQTDANGEFVVDWTNAYLNPVGLTYVDFTGITINEVVSAYPAGVAIVPYETEGQADFTVTEKNADGKTYVSISEIALHGYANLKLSATQEAGLKANTYYYVVVDVACNGESSAPVYFDDTATNGTPRFIIWGGGGQIKFNVQTDANGEFVVDWTKVYLNPVGLTYVDFTKITIDQE